MRAWLSYSLVSLASLIVGGVIVVALLFYLANRERLSNESDIDASIVGLEKEYKETREKACRGLYDLYKICHKGGGQIGFELCNMAGLSADREIDYSRIPGSEELSRSVVRQGCRDGSSHRPLMSYHAFDDRFCGIMENIARSAPR